MNYALQQLLETNEIYGRILGFIISTFHALRTVRLVSRVVQDCLYKNEKKMSISILTDNLKYHVVRTYVKILFF